MHLMNRLALAVMVAVSVSALAVAQDRATQTAAINMNDPRVGLKAGLHDAGVAVRNLELVAHMPKPPGFFDPKAPAGNPIPPERPANATPGAPGAPAPEGAAAAAEAAGAAAAEAGTPAPGAPGAGRPGGGPPPNANALSFTNSDIAFRGTHMFIGNYHGINMYDIERADRPRLLSSIVCPGGQGDVSVHSNLLFMSVEQTRGRLDCGAQGVTDTVSTERFRGVRIFDISDMRNPKQVAAVQTCRGSHTHTLVTDPKDQSVIYVYGSGTGAPRQGEELDGCVPDPKDPNTALFSIDVIKVPLANPAQAAIVNRPRIFADEKTGALGGLWQGGDHGPGTQTSRLTNQCHDITVFPEMGLAAGACSGNGILMDISDPINPKRLDHVIDKNFAYWHSATFNNDGTKVVFTDEWGGGSRPRCRATDLLSWGANAIFDVVDKKLQFRGYYKMPAPQSDTENCVAHNGSLIPVPGRDIMVQGWYQGGISVFDFTDSANPVEIAFFDRGPVDEKQLMSAGYWSVYWYNGHIYGSEIARGLDILKLIPSEHLSQAEIDAAVQVRHPEFNPQMQPRIEHPANFITARAYVDQLVRANALTADRANALRTAMQRADGNSRSRADLDQLESLASQIEKDAAAAQGRNSARMNELAAAIKGRIARLR
jgi:hypothetical protein